MPRSAPTSAEIAQALVDHGGADEGLVPWRRAASIVRDAFFTNNATARKWLDDAIVEDDPKVVGLFVYPGGVLSGILRRNEPGHAWYEPGGPETVLAAFEDFGYARTDGRLRVHPANGTFWIRPEPPPKKGPWLGVDRLPCVAVDLTLAGAASKCYEAIRREGVQRKWLAEDLPYLYGLLRKAGVWMPEGIDYADRLPPETVFGIDADNLHRIAKVLKKLKIKPSATPPTETDIYRTYREDPK